MTGRVQDWNRQSMRKDSSKPTHGVRDTGSLFHSKAPVMLADGGKVSDELMKQRGLEASNRDRPTGFFQRLREGNIDDPSSVAYQKYGAGRGRAEAQLDAAEAEMMANQANARAGSREMRQAARDDADFDAVAKDFQNTRAVAGVPAPAPARNNRVQVDRVEVTTPAAAPSVTQADVDAMSNRSRAARAARRQARSQTPAPAPAPAPSAPATINAKEVTERARADASSPATIRRIREKIASGERLKPQEILIARSNSLM